MAADRYTNFDSEFFKKYTDLAYYLSRGTSGNVFGPIKWNDMQLAIKQVMFPDGKVTDEFKKDKEVKKGIWTSIKHKQLMRIHSVDLSQLPKAMNIVMEFATGGSLNKTLRSLDSENKLPTDVVTDWAKQIAEGMMYLHQKNIVHRDLKSANILLMEPFDIRNPHVIATLKIADFDDVKEHDQTATMSFVGTCAYMAPEVLKNQRFSKASDVWSFGVLIWEMLSGDIPHQGKDTRTMLLKSQVGKQDNLPLKKSYPEDYKTILNRCWKSNYSKRLSFRELFCVLQRMGEGKDVAEILKFKGNILQKYFRDTPKESSSRHDPQEINPESHDVLYLREAVARNIVLGKITPMADENRNKRVRGLAILDDELFVTFETSNIIEVFPVNSDLSSHKSVVVADLVDPGTIAACAKNSCLYVMDQNTNSRKKIFRIRIRPFGTEIIKSWETDADDKGRISVNRDGNVVMTAYDKGKVKIYTPDGTLLRDKTIDISGKNITHIFHAINLADGNFIIGHGIYKSKLHQVCKIDAKEKVLQSFGNEKGSGDAQLNCPAYVAERSDGSILVADQDNHRIIRLNSELKFEEELFTKENCGVSRPRVMVVYEKTEPARLFLGCNETLNSGGYVLVLNLSQ